jgi:hypothetical protein
LPFPQLGQQMMAMTINPTETAANTPTSATETQPNQSKLRTATDRLNNANRAYLIFGAFIGVFSVLTLGASFLIYRFSNEKSAIEQSISDQKDRDMEAYKAGVAVQVASANKAASDALIRAAQLEKDAADARLETERLKAAVTWRTLSNSEAAHLQAALGRRPGAVNLRYMDGDPEALFLAIQISKILAAAHWQVAGGSWKPGGMLVFGLILPDGTGNDAQALRAAFSAAGLSFSTNLPPPSGSSVSFNEATIPGAPTLIVGSRFISPP